MASGLTFQCKGDAAGGTYEMLLGANAAARNETEASMIFWRAIAKELGRRQQMEDVQHARAETDTSRTTDGQCDGPEDSGQAGAEDRQRPN